MEDMSAQMNAILSNPEMMQKIMSLAQSMEAPSGQDQPERPSSDTPANPFPDLDMSAIQKLAGFAGKTNIDNNQRSLLKALIPYLSKERINKLERAMRAAKLASMATVLFGANGSLFRAGR